VHALRAALVAVGTLLAVAHANAEDNFADAVVEFDPGPKGGFGSNLLPDVVLGPPRGGGQTQGSFDVVSLGIGGSIVLRFDAPVICDGPGADFTVFENAFYAGSVTGPLFDEYGYVAVSQDGETFIELPYDAETGEGLAGRTPVSSNPDNDVSALDPSVSGGDSFDLAATGLAWASYVRITDVAGAIADLGDLPQFSVAPSAGFDLDAVAAVHACDPATLSTPTPSPTETPATTAPATPSTSPTETATSAPPTATATALPLVPGDLDGDGRVTALDARLLVAEIFDGDGDSAAAASGGAVVSGPAADVNGDGSIGAADLVGFAMLRAK
jgi:hypothetical protein